MVPKISLGMIQDCLSYVTTSWFGEHDFPAENMEEYDAYIEDMRRYAIKKNNLLYLKLGLEFLLSNNLIEDSFYEELSSECWDYEKEELMEIVSYIYSVVWCDRKDPEITRVPNIEIVRMGQTSDALAEWERRKNDLNPDFSESKVEYISSFDL